MENKIISFEGVTRVYGKGDNLSKAVDNVSFSINKGEFVVILGQSGAGKSTVLNMLGGIDTASEGKIIVAGKDITSMKESEYNDLFLSVKRGGFADTLIFSQVVNDYVPANTLVDRELLR